MKNILLVVLTIVLAGSVGVGSYFITKNLDSNEPNNDITNNEQNNNNQEEVKVVDAVNYSIEHSGKKFNVRIPKILGNTNNINNLNKEIFDYSINYAYRVYESFNVSNTYDSCYEDNSNVSISYNKGHTISYNYLIKNNIILLYIYDEVPEGGTGEQNRSSSGAGNNYFYDIKNDKTLKLSETAKALGITDIGEAPNYESLDNYCSKMIIDNSNIKIEYYEKCV